MPKFAEMAKSLKGNLRIIMGAAIVVIGALLIYSFSSKNSAPTKHPQELAIAGKGLIELSAEFNTSSTISDKDKKMGEEVLRALKLMGDGKDKTKIQQSYDAMGGIVRKYPDYSDGYVQRAMDSLMLGDADYQKIGDDLNNALKYQGSGKYALEATSRASIYALKTKVDILSHNLKQALDDLEAAVKINPGSLNDVFNTGAVKPDDDSNPTAVQLKDLNLLISEYPADYRSYMFRGLFYNAFSFYDKQYYKPAIDDLKNAISTNPRSALAYYFLGIVYQKAATFIYAFKLNGGTAAYDHARDDINAKALEDFKQATQIDPQFVPAYSEVAETLYSLKRFAESLPYYDKTIELDPNNAGAYNDRALAKLETKDYYEAISDFSSAIDLARSGKGKLSSLELAYENQADAYLKTNNYGAAIEDYGRAIGHKFSQQVFLMSIPQIRAIYPELSDISDQDLLEGFRQKYFPNMSSTDFINNYKDKKQFNDFVLAGLYEKRGDAYLASGNFRKAAIEYARALHDDTTYVLDRWKPLSQGLAVKYYVDIQTLDFGHGNNVGLWIKSEVPNSQNYSQQNFQIDCSGRRIKLMSLINYNGSGNALNTRPEQEWQSVIPDSLGEILYNNMCR